jgi:hypothetical protein
MIFNEGDWRYQYQFFGRRQTEKSYSGNWLSTQKEAQLNSLVVRKFVWFAWP